MSLKKFIAQENRVAELWGKGNPAWTVFPAVAALTPVHKKELANRLLDRKSTRLNSSHRIRSRMPSSA